MKLKDKMAALTHRERQILTGIGTLAVLLVLLFVFAGERNRQPEVADEPRTPAALEHLEQADEDRVFTDVETNEVIASFPGTLPLNSEDRITQQYFYIPAGSLQQQSTLIYESDLGLDGNRDVYLRYLADNGFSVQEDSAREGRRSLYARRGDEDLSVQIKSDNGRVTVSVSYLKR